MKNFLAIVNQPLKLKMFFLMKLPLALLVGLKVVSASNLKAVVSVKYRYLTQNPFKSMYFACMAMAAELSTGILVLNAVEIYGKNISTLVIGLEAEFLKKGIGMVRFECLEGEEINKQIKLSIDENIAKVIKTESIGYDENNNVVAKFVINWSVKCKV